jgi:hypothetical protein
MTGRKLRHEIHWRRQSHFPLRREDRFLSSIFPSQK